MAKVVHKPRNLRGLMPERIFAREWEVLASRPVAISDLDEEDKNVTEGQVIAAGCNGWMIVGQEKATLAATFITWLGTSVGASYLRAARTLEKQLAGVGPNMTGSCYLMAWARHNMRHRGVNSGWRTAEFLAWDGNWNDSRRFDPPVMTGEELELLDNMARWLGTDEGHAFVARCEAMILIEQKGLSQSDLSVISIGLRD